MQVGRMVYQSKRFDNLSMEDTPLVRAQSGLRW
jgi:hypothetical protein